MVDYPAAHSMDTTWFAVDDDGFVAVFDSGEAGAVPEVFDTRCDTWEAVEALENAPETAGRSYRLDPASLGWSPEAPTHRLTWQGRDTFNQRWLMFLTDLAPVETFLADGRGAVLPAVRGHAVIVMGLSRRVVDHIHAQGLCLGCEFYFGGDHEAAQVGFYEYEHTTENGISGPYGRDAVPDAPLRLDDLSEELREGISAVRLEGVRFADTTHVQPAGMMPCRSWQNDYMTLGGDHVPFEDEDDLEDA